MIDVGRLLSCRATRVFPLLLAPMSSTSGTGPSGSSSSKQAARKKAILKRAYEHC